MAWISQDLPLPSQLQALSRVAPGAWVRFKLDCCGLGGGGVVGRNGGSDGGCGLGGFGNGTPALFSVGRR